MGGPVGGLASIQWEWAWHSAGVRSLYIQWSLSNLDTLGTKEGVLRGCNVQCVWDSQMCPVYQGVLISEYMC